MRGKNHATSQIFIIFHRLCFSIFNYFGFECETLISSKKNQKIRIGIMDKNEFEDLGIEIWIRLFQESGQSLHKQIEEVKKKYE